MICSPLQTKGNFSGFSSQLCSRKSVISVSLHVVCQATWHAWRCEWWLPSFVWTTLSVWTSPQLFPCLVLGRHQQLQGSLLPLKAQILHSTLLLHLRGSGNPQCTRLNQSLWSCSLKGSRRQDFLYLPILFNVSLGFYQDKMESIVVVFWLCCGDLVWAKINSHSLFWLIMLRQKCNYTAFKRIEYPYFHHLSHSIGQAPSFQRACPRTWFRVPRSGIASIETNEACRS